MGGSSAAAQGPPYPPGEARTAKKHSASEGARRPRKVGSRNRVPAAAAKPDVARCTDPLARSLLLSYVLSRTQEAESAFFEAHLLACDACFRDLKFLDRAGSLLAELLGTAPRRAGS